MLGIGLLFGLGACATKPKDMANNDKPPIIIDEAQPIDKASKVPEVLADNTNDTPKDPNYSNDSAMEAEAKFKTQTLSIKDIGDRVYFPTDSYTLTPLAREVLAKQAHFLMSRPGLKIVIAGNCDERGTREYNLALGARRASAVKDYLISLGVNPGQLSTVSYGKERPLDARPSIDGWAVNRNAQTKIQ